MSDLQRTKGDYIADCLMELREGSAILREKFGEVTESEKKSSEDGASDSRAAVGKGKSKAAQVEMLETVNYVSVGSLPQSCPNFPLRIHFLMQNALRKAQFRSGCP